MCLNIVDNIVDVSPEIKILIKHSTKTFSSFRWVSLTAKESDRNPGQLFYSLTSMAYEGKSSFIGIKFMFVGSHLLAVIQS